MTAEPKSTGRTPPGTVYLVGAGPGDPGLMTLRAVELIGQADVILFDKLIPDGALHHARPDAELIDVGKIGGGRQVPQDETTDMVLRQALAGRSVVRLKGGDPFVFGRGGEEAQACRAAGVPFEVVPGVTAGVAVPAYAGIPVTQRGVAPAVAFVTGHEDPAKPGTQIDWPALAVFPGTLVFYMGVGQLPRISERLIASGRPAAQAAAIVQRGTHGDQRSFVGTLETLPAIAARERVGAPSIIVVGAVASLADELAWFAQARPLAGRTVAVTRARAQASGLAGQLRALGARVVEAPAISVEPLDATLPDLAAFDLLCVTSPNGARRLLELASDARALCGPTIAAIGPGTARALSEGGIRADVIPPRAVAESLIEALEGIPVKRALIARAQDARDVLPDALRARGADVEILPLYMTVAEALGESDLSAVLAADFVTFTSASSVRFFLQAAGGVDAVRRSPARLVSIGPITSEALREAGLQADIEAVEHDPDGLVAALLREAAAN